MTQPRGRHASKGASPMTGTARMCGVIAALIGTVACQSEANFAGSGRESEAAYEGAAGTPATWTEDEMSAQLDEAGSLEELLAQGPEPRGVDLPTDLVIEKRIVRNDNRVRVN